MSCFSFLQQLLVLFLLCLVLFLRRNGVNEGCYEFYLFRCTVFCIGRFRDICCLVFISILFAYCLGCVIFDLSCRIYGLICAIFGLSCRIYGLSCRIYGLICVIFDLSCRIYGLICAIFGLSCRIYGLICVILDQR